MSATQLDSSSVHRPVEGKRLRSMSPFEGMVENNSIPIDFEVTEPSVDTGTGTDPSNSAREESTDVEVAHINALVEEQDTNSRKRRYSRVFNPQQEGEEDISLSPSPVEENGDVESAFKPRRSLRLRTPVVEPEQCRVITRSKKLHANSSLKDIQNYYLDKKVKRLNLSLETIYEDPLVVDNENVVMSYRKFKRLIEFSAPAAKNSAKVKKRKAKAKKVKSRRGKKVSMKVLMEKLSEIEQE